MTSEGKLRIHHGIGWITTTNEQGKRFNGSQEERSCLLPNPPLLIFIWHQGLRLVQTAVSCKEPFLFWCPCFLSVRLSGWSAPLSFLQTGSKCNIWRPNWINSKTYMRNQIQRQRQPDHLFHVHDGCHPLTAESWKAWPEGSTLSDTLEQI